MSAREQLHAYMGSVRRRLRLAAWLRGAALCAATALAATVVLVAIANRFAFSSGSVAASRGTLLVLLAAAAAAGLVRPLRRLTLHRAAWRAESVAPELEQRLGTFSERDAAANDADPFLELLAEDTLALTPKAPPSRLVPDGWLFTSLGAAIACLGVLAWLIATGPGYWGYGAALLWTGPHAHAASPLYSLKVLPGNAVVRRHGDQMVTALPHDLPAPRIFARYRSASRWEAAPMRATTTGAYEYLFAGLPEDMEYYVQAGALRSKTYRIAVRDLPAVTGIAATYHYPAWTGLAPATVAHAGDLRAVAGTRATLQLTTDQPLTGGVLELDTGQLVPLTALGGNRYQAAFTLQKDGLYHVAAQVPGEDPRHPARISEDYFIAAAPAPPPQVAIVRPASDYRATPIEEVNVAVKAGDAYGLKGLALHYSVNGGPDQTINLLKAPGAKQANGTAVLSLESFHAQPGDLVSVYASARDGNVASPAHGVARTSMIFIQAEPFEREFSQSQQMGGGGGGGGGGNTASQIVSREKEIISATFQQQNAPGGSAAQAKLASDNAKLLYQSQNTLRNQATTLSGRLQARQLSDQNQAFSTFQQDMASAALSMKPAAASLKSERWRSAIPSEEKALRSLLRADATFRQIQVAFGARGGGGGGGSAGRDLASIFDLELDTKKNQYETPPTASSAQQRSQKIDDTLKKLDELAHRQQALAQARQNPAQSATQRWQEDMLRREAEQLQQQLQAMLNRQASGQQASGQGQPRGSQRGSRSGSQSAAGSGSSSGSASGSASGGPLSAAEQQAAQAALNRLQRANQALQRASTQSESPAQSAADARQAAQALQQAEQALASLQAQDAAARMATMANQASRLAGTQQAQASQIRKMASGGASVTPAQLNRLIAARQGVSDQYDRLEQQVRNTAQNLNATQPAASNQLRNAVSAADGDQLGTLLQRTADWLHQGNFSNSTESALTQGLQRLAQQLRQAQQALSPNATNPADVRLARAMAGIEQLRRQIARLGANGASPNRSPNPGPGGQQFRPGQLSRNGGQANGQDGARQAGGRQGGNQPGGAGGGNRAGGVGNRRVANAGGGSNRNGNFGGYDTGNTRIIGRAVAPQSGPAPADTERQIQQDIGDLNHMRAALPQDAETQRELQAFIQQMQGLSASRFPGNPQEVERLRQQLLASVDTLELQVRSKLDASQGGQIRSATPQSAPEGYRDAVAEYYRRLAGGK